MPILGGTLIPGGTFIVFEKNFQRVRLSQYAEHDLNKIEKTIAETLIASFLIP